MLFQRRVGHVLTLQASHERLGRNAVLRDVDDAKQAGVEVECVQSLAMAGGAATHGPSSPLHCSLRQDTHWCNASRHDLHHRLCNAGHNIAWLPKATAADPRLDTSFLSANTRPAAMSAGKWLSLQTSQALPNSGLLTPSLFRAAIKSTGLSWLQYPGLQANRLPCLSNQNHCCACMIS